MSARKRQGLEAVAAVAVQRGGRVEPEHGQWPDAWLVEASGDRIPVEVVSAHQRLPGEGPKKGAPSVAAEKRAEVEVARRHRQGERNLVYGVQGHREYVQTVNEPLPLPLRPIHPATWVRTAIEQKQQKRYAGATDTILVVDFQWMPPEDFELRDLGDELLAAHCPFREVWVVSPFSAMGDRSTVQRVPLESVRQAWVR